VTALRTQTQSNRSHQLVKAERAARLCGTGVPFRPLFFPDPSYNVPGLKTFTYSTTGPMSTTGPLAPLTQRPEYNKRIPAICQTKKSKRLAMTDGICGTVKSEKMFGCGGRWTGSDRASHPPSGSKAKAITRAEHSHDFNYAHNILHMNTLIRSVFGSMQTGGVSRHSQRQPPIRGPRDLADWSSLHYSRAFVSTENGGS
jgi:hypothetical protein